MSFFMQKKVQDSMETGSKKGYPGVIPIPIHRHKRYKRGYNQAEVYAKELGKQCGLPMRQ